jgi:hypothetical protein
VPPPRFSHGYFWLRNRMGMLVETHSWKTYPVRVRITRNTILSVLHQASEHGREWLRIAQDADKRASALARQSVPLAFAATQESRIVEFRGYEYTRTPSEISGALMTRYDESKPQIWKIPLRDQLQPSINPIAPGAGYLVPAAHAEWVAEKLRIHGIEFRKLRAMPKLEVQTFLATEATPAAQSSEGRQRMSVQGQWKNEVRGVEAGALFVPIAQPRSRLVMSILEPLAPDSLVAWGEFNNAFERKEYMEDYVAEEVAREMLTRDPALKARFEQKLKDDPAFAKSPAARLEFFYRLHTSWDERYNLYPVMRTDAIPADSTQ